MSAPPQFGQQCDALTAKGCRCKRTNQAYYPTQRGEGEPSKPVRLCWQHSRMRDSRRTERLPLIGGGHLTGWDEYHYGNMVTCERHINRSSVDRLTIPAYWAAPEDDAR